MTARDPWFTPDVPTTDRGPVGNPFDDLPTARRYRTGRIYYHEEALTVAARRLTPMPAGVALDVACGTGLSSRALCRHADRVVAIDASNPMLRAAETRAGVTYVQARADHLPCAPDSFDLATVAAAFHWFDAPTVLTELARVLRPGAALVVYTDFFHGVIGTDHAFRRWFTDRYLPTLPTPPRHAYFDAEAAQDAGFSPPTYDESEIDERLTAEQVADYLLSQSNAAAMIRSSKISAHALRDTILAETGSFFPDDRARKVTFGIRVWTMSLQA